MSSANLIKSKMSSLGTAKNKLFVSRLLVSAFKTSASFSSCEIIFLDSVALFQSELIADSKKLINSSVQFFETSIWALIGPNGDFFIISLKPLDAMLLLSFCYILSFKLIKLVTTLLRLSNSY